MRMQTFFALFLIIIGLKKRKCFFNHILFTHNNSLVCCGCLSSLYVCIYMWLLIHLCVFTYEISPIFFSTHFSEFCIESFHIFHTYEGFIKDLLWNEDKFQQIRHNYSNKEKYRWILMVRKGLKSKCIKPSSFSLWYNVWVWILGCESNLN